MKRKLCGGFLLLAMVLSVCLTGCGSEAVSVETKAAAATESSTATGLTITALSVGKADALLVQADGHSALIDTGERTSAETVLAALKQHGISRLDLLLITHFDKDHVGGAAAILDSVPADSILYPDYVGSGDEYAAFMEAISGNSGAQTVTAQYTCDLGGAELTIYPAEDPDEILKEKGEQDNDFSLVSRVEYGSRSFLFCGDVEATRISQMLDSDTDWESDWIKLPHHGAYDKRVKKLLEAVEPGFAVITDSEEEPADKSTRKYLKKNGIAYAETADGTIVTVCDGENITMTTVS